MKTVKDTDPLPAYFISHGSPSMIYPDDIMTDKKAYETLQQIGQEIKVNRPDYIVIVSAHWQSSRKNVIEISLNDNNCTKDFENDILYDFQGFNQDLYKERFVSRASPYIVDVIHNSLTQQGCQSIVVKRGLDHGAWIPLKIAFGETISIPVIQISLPLSDDFTTNYQLGKALQVLRTTPIVNDWANEPFDKPLRCQLICSGCLVHSLIDLKRSCTFPNEIMPYVDTFINLIEEILEDSTPLTLLQSLNNLKRDSNYRQLLYQSHPSLEHFLPLVVAAGSNDSSCDIYSLYVGGKLSIGYGFFKFNL